MRFIMLLFSLMIFTSNTAMAAPKQLNPLESQLMSFMNGLHVGEPKQAVELWILGVNNRSGAVQYAMLTPSLQKQSREKFEQTHWVTGGSSPWVSNLRITKVERLSDSKMRYTLKYEINFIC